jgi:hypothetical protein
MKEIYDKKYYTYAGNKTNNKKSIHYHYKIMEITNDEPCGHEIHFGSYHTDDGGKSEGGCGHGFNLSKKELIMFRNLINRYFKEPK